MRFTKAHGLGNDFLLVDAAQGTTEIMSWARRLCDRHEGVGADGLILYDLSDADVGMRLFNADGGEAEISGNGLRCLAAHVARLARRPERHVVRTAAGPRPVEVSLVSGSRYRVRSGLGPAILGSEAIPIDLTPPRESVVGLPVEAAGQTVTITATSLGNPHCAVFLDAVATDEQVATLGAALERHPLFPRRTNVEFVTVTSREELRVRFWERGVGPTRASGTGSASAVVAAVLNGRAERHARVVCDGGALDVEWPEGSPVMQTGEVELLFNGDWMAEGPR